MARGGVAGDTPEIEIDDAAVVLKATVLVIFSVKFFRVT
jgi:hypothetical protein